MKKLFKVIMALVFMLSCFGILNVSAKSSMTLNKITNIKSGVGNRTETKFHTSKGYAYCISPTKQAPPIGSKLAYKGKINDGGLLYLLKQATSGNHSTVITRIAVWKYYNNHMVSIYKQHPNAKVVKEANALVSKAKKNKNNLDKNPTVKVSASKTAMSEVENGKYFKSGAITVKLGNVSSGTISVTSPAKVVNASGSKVSTVKNGQKVYVKVAASNITKKKSFVVKVKVSKKVYFVEKYSPSNSKYQTLVVLASDTKSDSAKATVTATPVVRKCQYANGKYYGKNGTVVDKTTYSIQCEKHTCEKVGNVYFGKNGTQVSYDTFNLECNKHVCEKVGDTYFGKDGNIVDEEEFNLECTKHVCEIIGDKYYGKYGFVVDEITYDIQCNPHQCQKVGDTYFGKDGNIVDEDTYDLECNKHICEIIGDKYFGKDGIEVDEPTYNAECVHTCQIIGDKYYGETGEEVTADEYRDQCTHSCEIDDGKYYGKDGNEVSEEEYENQCEGQVVSVPDTGTTPLASIILTVLGLSVVAGAAGMVIRYQKING